MKPFLSICDLETLEVVETIDFPRPFLHLSLSPNPLRSLFLTSNSGIISIWSSPFRRVTQF